MPTPYDSIPAPTRERLLVAGRSLGRLEDIIDDKIDPDADLAEKAGLAAGAVGILGIASIPLTRALLGGVFLLQYAFLALVVVGLVELVRCLRRRARNRRRRYIGLFEHGLAEVQLGSDATHVVPFAGATADVRSAWGAQPRGRRAERATLTVRGREDAITYVAANDAAYFQLNAILRRLPGTKPVLRDKEPGYHGD